MIVSVDIFLVIKQMNRIRDEFDKKEEEPEKKKVEDPKDIQLLSEIRDLIKNTKI
jgi:large-conductance mechanosensitive channel